MKFKQTNSSDNENIVIIKNLTKQYGSLKSLDKLDLNIQKGTSVAFLGPNGAGKSTAIKILTGNIKPTSGNVLINGFDIQKNPRLALHDVGSIVETPAFISEFTPEEVLSYFGELRGILDADLSSRIDEVLRLVKLEKWRKEKIKKFSKGMRQRVGIASAIIHDPSLLILDEPTDGLDPRGRQEIQDLLQLLRENGKTIFISSHILSEIKNICDTIAVIDKGVLLAHKKTDDLDMASQIEIETINSPTQQQLDLILKFEEIVDILQKDATTILLKPKTNITEQQQEKLLSKIQEIGIRIISFNLKNQSLEEMYMSLIGESTR